MDAIATDLERIREDWHANELKRKHPNYENTKSHLGRWLLSILANAQPDEIEPALQLTRELFVCRSSAN